MLKLSLYFFTAGYFTAIGAGVLYLLSLVRQQKALAAYGSFLVTMSLILLTGSLALRWVAAGRGPFSNMYEFSLSFAWGTIAGYSYLEHRYRTPQLGALVVPVAAALLWYASTLPSEIAPLVPALQNDLLLTLHVAVAVIAYGAFAAAFGAGLAYLVQRSARFPWLPAPQVLDNMGYRAVVIGFPFMGLVIILGAIWADVAWGRYWSWDPKETASLVTWLVYGGYLHARHVASWRGNRSAALLVLGFGATLFTYFGNLFFTGLHSYKGF
ncbi:MAG: cytochrome c biogenesis protein CcsA [Chloroflexi bacterium]|nr:cytochrome c biogenesis protein CcsA [Chloroflexota bacterium]